MSYSSVKNMLTNKFYAERFKYGAKEYDGNHPVMLSVQKNKAHKCSQKSINVSEEKLLAQVKEELAKYTIDDDFFNLAIKALNEEEELKIKDQNMKTRELRGQYDARKK